MEDGSLQRQRRPTGLRSPFPFASCTSLSRSYMDNNPTDRSQHELQVCVRQPVSEVCPPVVPCFRLRTSAEETDDNIVNGGYGGWPEREAVRPQRLVFETLTEGLQGQQVCCSVSISQFDGTSAVIFCLENSKNEKSLCRNGLWEKQYLASSSLPRACFLINSDISPACHTV